MPALPDEIDEPAGERAAILKQLAQARRFVEALRGYYVIGAAFFGLFLVPMVLSGTGGAATVIFGVGFASMLAGAVLIRRHPVGGSLGMALFTSAILAFGLVSQLLATGEARVGIFAAVAVGCWIAVGLAAKAERLRRSHPEEWRATWRTGEGEGRGTRHRERSRADRARSRKRTALFVGSGIAALVAFGFIAHALTAPKEPEPLPPAPPIASTLAAFDAAWNGPSLAAIQAFFPAGTEDPKAHQLELLFKHRNWLEKRPRLGTPRLDESYGSGRIAAYYPVAGEDPQNTLRLSWQYEGGRWTVVALKPPKSE